MIGKLLVLTCLLAVVHAAVFKHKVNKLPSRYTEILKGGKPHQFRAYHSNQRKNLITRLERAIQTPAQKNRASRLYSQPLYDYFDQWYIVNVTIGSPPQNFRFLLDTLIGDSWVVDKTCDPSVCSCGGSDPNCDGTRTFDSGASSTYKPDGRPFTDNRTGGTGFLGQDTFGLATGLSVKNVVFGQVSKPFAGLNSYPIDGFLGLTRGSDDGVKSVIELAYEQKLLKDPMFTIYSGVEDISSFGGKSGRITYGEVDTDNCSPDFKFISVISTQFWEFNVDSTEIAGRVQKNKAWKGIVFGESSVIGLPQSVMDDIAAATNAEYDMDLGTYMVDCKVQFKWTITLGGSKFVVDETTSILQFQDTCYLALDAGQYPGFEFILGSPFARDYCIVYDLNGRLGFSREIAK